MKADKFIDLEKVYTEITSDLFGDDSEWFESAQAHSLYTPAVTMWLMLLQALHQGSLKDALDFIEQGQANLVIGKNTSKKARSGKYSKHTGGYSQARSRLAPQAVQALVEELTKRVYQKIRPETERAAVLLDGTLLTVRREKDITKRYPVHSNNHRVCLPQIRLVFAADVRTGATSAPKFDSNRVSEQKLCYQVLDELSKDTIVIADRNFGIFSVLSRCLLNELDAVIRLTDSRARKILGGTVPEESDKVVTWDASKNDVLLDEDSPKNIMGRIICTTLYKDGEKPIHLALFTTLDLPKEKIIGLYGKRNLIETDIRQLKITLEADFITAKSASMVKKELLIRFAAYNLVAFVIKESAHAVNLLPRQLSFTYMLSTIKTFGMLFRTATTQAARDKHWLRYLECVPQNRLYERKKPRTPYPRTLVRNPRHFPLAKHQ